MSVFTCCMYMSGTLLVCYSRAGGVVYTLWFQAVQWCGCLRVRGDVHVRGCSYASRVCLCNHLMSYTCLYQSRQRFIVCNYLGLLPRDACACWFIVAIVGANFACALHLHSQLPGCLRSKHGTVLFGTGNWVVCATLLSAPQLSWQPARFSLCVLCECMCPHPLDICMRSFFPRPSSTRWQLCLRDGTTSTCSDEAPW